MGIFILIYCISAVCSLCTIPIFAEKNVCISCTLFLMFCPIVNIIWLLFCIIKGCFKERHLFLKDLKKVFDIK